MVVVVVAPGAPELRCAGAVWCGAARQKLAESAFSNESIRLQKSTEQIGAELRSSSSVATEILIESMPLAY